MVIAALFVVAQLVLMAVYLYLNHRYTKKYNMGVKDAEDFIANMDKAAVAEQVPVLLAVNSLVQAGMLKKFAWTPPTTGTDVVKYECDLTFFVPDASAVVVRASATDMTLRVRGIDAEGRAGPWSQASDPL